MYSVLKHADFFIELFFGSRPFNSNIRLRKLNIFHSGLKKE